MTPGNEFEPIGKHIESSRQLELDFHDQQNLIFEMKQTARELEDSPLVTPTIKEVKLGRIALLDGDGQRSPRNKLWVQYSEADDGRHNALIDLLEDEVHTRFQLSPTTNKWDIFQKGSSSPTKDFSSEYLVNFLQPKLRKPETFNSILDSANFDPMIIPHLLASHLARQSNRREKRILYQSSDGIVHGVDPEEPLATTYVSSASTSLSIFDVNGRSIHTLRARAPYALGNTTITKEYAYRAETSDTQLYGASGSVTMASKDGYNRAKLLDFAVRDQETNEPVFTLHRSLAKLRKEHGLEDSSAA